MRYPRPRKPLYRQHYPSARKSIEVDAFLLVLLCIFAPPLGILFLASRTLR